MTAASSTSALLTDRPNIDCGRWLDLEEVPEHHALCMFRFRSGVLVADHVPVCKLW